LAAQTPRRTAGLRSTPSRLLRYLSLVRCELGTVSFDSSGAKNEQVLAPASHCRHLVGALAARLAGLWLALSLVIERHRGADEILQGRVIDFVAFVNIDGPPEIAVEAGVE
jgi:hypothetical protein